MELLQVTVQVWSLKGREKKLEERFYIDSAEMNCTVDAAKLRELGVEPESPDGDFGFARLRIMGLDTVAKVLFGPSGCSSRMGLVALETAGLEIEAGSSTLKRMTAKPLK